MADGPHHAAQADWCREGVGPGRAYHHRESLDEPSQDLERRAFTANNQPSAERGHGYAVCCQRTLDLDSTLEVARLCAVGRLKSTHVDDVLDSVGCGC